MKRANWVGGVCLIATLILGFPMESMGQEAQLNKCVVKAGDYRDLTFFRKFKIGAASFLAPSILKTSALAYSYDPQQLLAKTEPSKLVNELRDGSVALASKTNGSYTTYEIGSPIWNNLVSSLKKVGSTSDEKQWSEVIFLSPVEKLDGVSPTSRLISWDATLPISTGPPPACN